jgi:hypothetical protein
MAGGEGGIGKRVGRVYGIGMEIMREGKRKLGFLGECLEMKMEDDRDSCHLLVD